MASSSTDGLTFTAAAVRSSFAGRAVWSDVVSSDDEVVFISETVATRAETLPTSIATSTFRTTRIDVRELAYMKHKSFMCHCLDTILRLKGLIFSKFGIRANRQRLMFRGLTIKDGDITLFAQHLLGERLVHIIDDSVSILAQGIFTRTLHSEQFTSQPVADKSAQGCRLINLPLPHCTPPTLVVHWLDLTGPG
jgi:hypothetical protein